METHLTDAHPKPLTITQPIHLHINGDNIILNFYCTNHCQQTFVYMRQVLIRSELLLTMLHIITIQDNIISTNITSENKSIKSKMKELLV